VKRRYLDDENLQAKLLQGVGLPALLREDHVLEGNRLTHSNIATLVGPSSIYIAYSRDEYVHGMASAFLFYRQPIKLKLVSVTPNIPRYKA
jgi:hypothetical protein